MSIIEREPTRQCPRCRLLMRRFLTSLPGGAESPWCRACTMKSLLKSRPDPPNLDPELPYPWSAVRATLHDPAAPPELRRFAFAVLNDHRWATHEDRRAVVLLALAQEQAPGAHGAGPEGPERFGAGRGAGANRDRGRRPDGEAREPMADGGQR